MTKKFNNSILKSITLTDELFSDIISSSLSDVEFIYLSSNPSLNKEQIEYLFLLNIENVNINLLRNSNCSEERINQFLLYKDKIYNIAIAHNLALTEEIINELIKTNDKDVSMSLEYSGIKKGTV